MDVLDAAMAFLFVMANVALLGCVWIDHYFKRKREYLQFCMTTRPQERSSLDG